MKKMMIASIAILIFSAASLAGAFDKIPEVKEIRKSGIYAADVFNNGRYMVDTIAQLCYFTRTQATMNVPCKSLKKRPEWASIITWEK